MKTPTIHTDDRATTTTGISRRRVLQSTALTTGVLGLGLPLSSTTVLADDHTDGRIDTFDILPALKREDSTKWSLRFRVSSGFKDAFA